MRLLLSISNCAHALHVLLEQNEVIAKTNIDNNAYDNFKVIGKLVCQLNWKGVILYVS